MSGIPLVDNPNLAMVEIAAQAWGSYASHWSSSAAAQQGFL